MPKRPQHHQPKPPQSFSDQARDWAVGRVRTIVLIIGGIGTVAGAVVGYSKASEVIEPIWYASRSYVREHIDSRIKTVQDTTAPLLKELLDGQRAARIEQAEGKRESAEQNKAKIQAELVKGGLTPTAKDILDSNLHDLDTTIKKLNQQIRALGSER